MSRIYPFSIVFVIMMAIYGFGCAQTFQGMDGSGFMLVGSQGGRYIHLAINLQFTSCNF